MAGIATSIPSWPESLPAYSSLRGTFSSLITSDTFPNHALQPSLLSAAAIVTLTVLFLHRASRDTKLPRAVVGIPVLGNMIEYSKNPLGYLRWAMARYGQFFQVKMLFTNTIWLMGPEMNKLYLSEKEDVWSFGAGMMFLNKIVVPTYFSNMKIFASSVNRGVSRPAALRHSAEMATDQCIKDFNEWSSAPPIDLFKSVSRLVHATLVRTLMGEDFYEYHSPELNSILHEMHRDVGHIFNFILPEWIPHPPARRLNAARDRVVDIFHQRLRAREAQPELWEKSEDYISFTLRDPATAHLQHLYPAHHTVVMFAAHTSTVANISWTILELLKSPERIARLREEFDAHIPRGTSGESLFNTYAKLPFLQASLRETGRHYSGINMFRLSLRPVTLPNGIYVPPNTVVSVSPYLTHHDPSLYPNPDAWSPERFLDNPELPRHMNRDGKVAYLPFGAGVHRCPGEKFANMLASVVVSLLFRDYEVEWPEGMDRPETSTLDFTKVGAPWAKKPVYVCVRRRKGG